MSVGSGRALRLPPHGPGLRIGLYGGSFDPPHAGHRHVALTALRRLRLDRVWWLVVPGNPLKDRSRLASRSDRLRATREIARHPAMRAIDLGEAVPSLYTVDALRAVLARAPGVRFVWIMGADSLGGFHRWRAWQTIAGLVPIAVVDRPGATLRATASRAALALGRARLPEAEASSLADLHPPAWVFLHGPRSALSSTLLREKSKGARATR